VTRVRIVLSEGSATESSTGSPIEATTYANLRYWLLGNL
jgi:hypothetical protein